MHDQDELLEDLLINSNDDLQTEIAVANDLALHPWHQNVQDKPHDYVTIHKDMWNRIVTLAGQSYQRQWQEKVKQAAIGNKTYPCRHPNCNGTFTNSSNRRRHEKKDHPLMNFKEDGHAA